MAHRPHQQPACVWEHARNVLGFIAQSVEEIGAISADEVIQPGFGFRPLPDLMLAIKESVDKDRRPGRFIVSGSADIRTAPKIQESLAGGFPDAIARGETAARRTNRSLTPPY